MIDQYFQGLPLTLCVAQWGSWVSGRRKQRSLSRKPDPNTAGWHQSSPPRSDKTEKGQADRNHLFSLSREVLRLNTKIKKHSWRHRLKKQPLIIDIWTPAEEKGQQGSGLRANSYSFNTAIVHCSSTTDSPHIQLNEMLASPPSLLWQAFMIISSRLCGLTYPAKAARDTSESQVEVDFCCPLPL